MNLRDCQIAYDLQADHRFDEDEPEEDEQPDECPECPECREEEEMTPEERSKINERLAKYMNWECPHGCVDGWEYAYPGWTMEDQRRPCPHRPDYTTDLVAVMEVANKAFGYFQLESYLFKDVRSYEFYGVTRSWINPKGRGATAAEAIARACCEAIGEEA